MCDLFTLGIPCSFRVASVMTARVPSDPINSRVRSYPEEYGRRDDRVWLVCGLTGDLEFVLIIGCIKKGVDTVYLECVLKTYIDKGVLTGLFRMFVDRV